MRSSFRCRPCFRSGERSDCGTTVRSIVWIRPPRSLPAVRRPSVLWPCNRRSDGSTTPWRSSDLRRLSRPLPASMLPCLLPRSSPPACCRALSPRVRPSVSLSLGLFPPRSLSPREGCRQPVQASVCGNPPRAVLLSGRPCPKHRVILSVCPCPRPDSSRGDASCGGISRSLSRPHVLCRPPDAMRSGSSWARFRPSSPAEPCRVAGTVCCLSRPACCV